MPVAKRKASSSPDAMKAEVGNDSLDAIIKQGIGKEHFLSFSRAGDRPVQWIQLLQALDQQELPGWPVLTRLKVQLQKCDKCSQEFCSQFNYRRHLHVQHRLKKLDKDSTNNRDMLGVYWDKLSLEEEKEVLSFKNVMLEEVPGSTILKALATLIGKQGFSSFPHYLKAGSAFWILLKLDTVFLYLHRSCLVYLMMPVKKHFYVEMHFLCRNIFLMERLERLVLNQKTLLLAQVSC